MSESNREHLSSLMDGELKQSEARFLVRRLTGDGQMKATWRRYHLVRACLHGESISGDDLGARVAQALNDEPALRARSPGARWLKPIAGGAIAAGVALFAIIGINQSLLDQSPVDSAANEPGFVSQPTPLDRPFSQAAVPVSFGSASERQRINQHLLRHNQAAGGAGFVSFVPIVTQRPVEARPAPGADDSDSTPLER